MSGLRTNLALIESAADEMTAHYFNTAHRQGAQIGDLIGKIQTALVQIRTGKPDLARTTLERALQENKL